MFRDGITFLLASARRTNPKRDRKKGGSGAAWLSSEPFLVITYMVLESLFVHHLAVAVSRK